MPWYVREILVAAEEFRAAVPREMGRESRSASPMIPLLREEAEALVRRQMVGDEQLIFRQLARLGSKSAGLIVELWLTRGVLREAFACLRDDRAAQVTSASIISATKFRVHY